MTAQHKQLEARFGEECKPLAGPGFWWWVSKHRNVAERGGMIDAWAIGTRGMLFAELKSDDGRRTREQIKVGRLLLALGMQYRVYRMSDFDDGTVRRDLEAIVER